MIKRLIIKLIRWYQKTPLSTHRNCKFIPSCSQYTIDALEIHGLFKGLALGTWRILRCNPFNKGGIDYVKPKK